MKQADATLYVNGENGDTAIQTIEFLRRQRSETARRPNVWVQVQGNLASIELPALTVSSLRFAVKEAWPSLRFDAARLILVEHEGLDKTNMTLKVNTPENPYTIREPWIWVKCGKRAQKADPAVVDADDLMRFVEPDSNKRACLRVTIKDADGDDVPLRADSLLEANTCDTPYCVERESDG